MLYLQKENKKKKLYTGKVIETFYYKFSFELWEFEHVHNNCTSQLIRFN